MFTSKSYRGQKVTSKRYRRLHKALPPGTGWEGLVCLLEVRSWRHKGDILRGNIGAAC